MKKLAVLLFSGGSILGLIALANIDSADARPKVRKRFENKYSPEGAPEAWVELVKKTKCHVCHNPNYLDEDGDEDKEYRNAFGEAVHKFLKEKDYKDYKAAIRATREEEDQETKDKLKAAIKAAYYKKIDEALEKAGALKIDPKNGKSKTWNELFKGHKLPENPNPPKK